jgi:ATP/maltotriose-dependent transcriptional regulator MalT
MGWLERRKQRRRQRKELEAADARLRGLTPREIAEKVIASDLAGCVPTGDKTKLAEQIAVLTDRERYILAMAAEGRSAHEIARWFFDPIDRVSRELRRILEQHLGVAHGAAGDWLVRRRKNSEGY